MSHIKAKKTGEKKVKKIIITVLALIILFVPQISSDKIYFSDTGGKLIFKNSTVGDDDDVLTVELDTNQNIIKIKQKIYHTSPYTLPNGNELEKKELINVIKLKAQLTEEEMNQTINSNQFVMDGYVSTDTMCIYDAEENLLVGGDCE